MKNKGFSMIELLAVIIILGIISGIAIFGVTRYLESSRKTAYENMGKTLYESTKSYFISNSGKIPDLNQTTTIYAGELVTSGYTEEIKDPKKNTNNCNQSTIKVTQVANSDNMDANEIQSFNQNLQYEITIICEGITRARFKYPKKAGDKGEFNLEETLEELEKKEEQLLG